jgi:hypothetical protein
MHWDGTSWKIVTSPQPDASLDILTGVTAISTNDVWAVGLIGTATLVFQSVHLSEESLGRMLMSGSVRHAALKTAMISPSETIALTTKLGAIFKG